MGDTASDHLNKVSYHAVARYCERILGVRAQIDPKTLPPVPNERSRAIAQAYCDVAQKTIDAVRAEILTPAVLDACLSGLSHLGTAAFHVKIARDTGVVLTVLSTGEFLRKYGKVKAPTRPETRKQQRRANRSRLQQRKSRRDRE